MPSRDELACLKRADLQRLCKSYGIRANLKSEELVELLLQESSGPSKFPSHAGPSTPPLLSRTTSVRVLSRMPSTRSRLNTAHTTLNQLEREAGCTAATAHPAPVSQSDGVANGPATRTRKAKDTQFRLGVGRPTAAGGSGARSITKSASLGKSRRGRISRSGKPSEATIPEESTADVEMGNVPIPAATKKHVLPISSQSSMNPTGTLTDLRPLLRAYLEQELQPFNATISALRLELQEQATTHQNEMNSLKDRLELLTVELDALRRENTSNLDDINGKIERLQTENARARGSVDPITDPFNSPVPARQSTDGSQPPDATTLKLTTHGLTRTIRPSTKFEYPPPPSTKKASKESGYHVLGKRPRPPENSEPGPSRTTNSRTSAAQAEQFEASDEATSPSRKRPRLESDEIGVHVAKSSFPTFAPPLPSESRHPSSDTPRPGFSVYSGPEESLQANNALRAPLDEQFFAESDFDYFDSQQSTRQGSHVTSTSNAIENNPFAFALTTSLSRTLTPTTTAAPAPAELESDDTPVINNFPYPQAPHSPSPAPHRSSTRPPDSSRSTASSIPAESSGNSGNVHPVAVPPPRTPPPNTGSIEQQAFRRIAGSDIGFGFGPGISFHTPTGPAGRTLYGTELDVDQRFGDFGYDGVASGFWSGS